MSYAENLAANYVGLLNEMGRLAEAVATGRWSDASNIAYGLREDAEHLGDAASAATEDGSRAPSAAQVAKAIADRGDATFQVRAVAPIQA